MRILYVEDDAQDRDLTTRVLRSQRQDWTVDAVESLSAAQDVLQQRTYDLLLTDLRLGGGSGLELLQVVEMEKFPIPVVIVTGRGDEETAIAALRSGAYDYIVKRDDYLVHLSDVLEHALARYQKTENRQSRTLRVLYAEPNQADVDLTQRHFARHAPHIHLEAVNYGYAALDKVMQGPIVDIDRHNGPYDVILLDYRLPGLSGLDLLKEIRQVHHLDVPVVLITGRGNEETVRQALKLGADDYIIKSTGYLSNLPIVIENAYYRQEIERERDHYRNLYNRVPVGLYRTTLEGQVLSANAALVEMFGYTSLETLLETPVRDLYVDPEDREDLIAEVERTGSVRYYEVQLKRQDETPFWASIDGSLSIDPVGKARFLEGAIQDVTSRKEMRAQLDHQNRLAAVGRLAGGIAHDFNNILAAIVLYAQMPLAQGDLRPNVQHALQTILEQSKRAADLVNQILDFSRRAMIRTEVLDLTDLVTNALPLVQRTIPENIVLLTELPPFPCVIRADSTRIHQALMNLTINAIDAMPDGGTLSIMVKANTFAESDPRPVSDMSAGAWVALTVADTGMGMSATVQGHLFEPFFTTKEVGKGTGLGLAQVYGIVKQHGGFIDVESAPGAGARFTLYLPYVSEVVRGSCSSEVTEAGAGQAETILVVEDMDSLRDAIKAGLVASNYRVLAAAEGEAALALVETEHIDLCLTDIGMPRMGGRQLLVALRDQVPDLTIIAMTGHVMETDAEMLSRNGFDSVLYKPFSISELRDSVRSALDSRARQ